jgi:hypothetical protein
VSTALAHSLLGGVPLLLLLVLIALIWGVGKNRKGPHPATYKMSEPWTHSSILGAATDEAVGGAHGGHDTSEFSIGGGASGTW